MLAHGGTVGAAAEIGFILVPVAIFWILARWAKRRAATEASTGNPDGKDPG